MSELCALLERHCQQEFTTTAVPRLNLSRADQPTKPREAIYYPLLCVVAQGRKQVFVGDTVFDYDPSTYLIATVGLPAIGQVTKAPYLGLTYGLDLEVLASLQLAMPTHAHRRTATSGGLAVNPLDAGLLDPLLRLLRLLDRPEEIPIMGPLIEREIHYRLLLGPQREMLGQLATPTSHLSQIGRAFNFIRQHYNQFLRVDELARLAGMSTPTFHRHFRAVTAMSPLQYQKQIRLQEARRLLQTQSAKANSVAYQVGYESSSQFSREYRRVFGIPPSEDALQTRRALTPPKDSPARSWNGKAISDQTSPRGRKPSART